MERHGGDGSSISENKPLPEITMRPFNLSDDDAEALMSWASDPRVVRFQRREPYTNKQQAVDYIANHILPHPWYRAICTASDGQVVGSVSVKRCSGSSNDCRASLGYRLAYEHWGKGIATAAVKKVVEQIFVDWPELQRLEAVADVENQGSQRVLEKAGFKKEAVLRKYMILKGVTRDVIMYSILSSDPR